MDLFECLNSWSMENLLDFIKKTNYYKKFEVDELLFTEFKCPFDETKSSIWWHNNFFAYVLTGETLLKTPHREYLLRPGDCAFAKKGSVITMSHAQEDFCELLVFVPDEFIKAVVQKHQVALSEAPVINKTDTVIPLATDNVLNTYFQSLLSYFSLSIPPHDSLLKLKFEELIIDIFCSPKHESLKAYFKELCARAKPSIREIMEANFSSNLSLADFARMCGRSLSAFKREFIALYQTTPGKWLTEKRLEYSRYLLHTTNLNIEEVCFESGFENRSHFIRIFKSKYGITPGTFHLQQKEPESLVRY